MPFLSDPGFLVTTLPQGTGAVVGLVDVVDIAPPQHLHHLCDPQCLRQGDQQMHMIRHQDIGVNTARVFIRTRLQIVEVTAVIRFRQESGFSVVAALDDMLRNAGQGEVGFSGHGSPPGERHEIKTPLTSMDSCRKNIISGEY